MIFNTVKSVAMIFAPYDTKRHVNYQFPSFTISGETLQNVNIFKYLGHLIFNDLYDDDDIVRQMGLLYGRTNFLCRKFSNCSMEVKITLFRTYCLSFYCMSLWERFHKKGLEQNWSSICQVCQNVFWLWEIAQCYCNVLATKIANVQYILT